jgi:hypothetical protein
MNALLPRIPQKSRKERDHANAGAVTILVENTQIAENRLRVLITRRSRNVCRVAAHKAITSGTMTSHAWHGSFTLFGH